MRGQRGAPGGGVLKQQLTEDRELMIRIARERAPQAEGAAGTKALRCEWAWLIRGQERADGTIGDWEELRKLQ